MGDQTPPERFRLRLVLLTLVGVALALLYAGAELSQSDWDAAGVISFGREEPERVEYAFEQFDREIPLEIELGHDGRFFFIQAMDPLLLSPSEHATYLDRPTYRAQRMLYPTLAGLLGFGQPELIAWAMLAINVVAFVAGTFVTGRLAASFCLTPWWGLAFALNPGVRFELDIDGAGVIAMTALMLALLLVRSGRWGLVLVALVAATLAREVMLIAAVGIALSRGIGPLRRRLGLVLVPGLAAAAWWVYVHLRLADLSTAPAVEELGLPFRGIWQAAQRWVSEPGIDLAMGLVFVFVTFLMLVRALRFATPIEMSGAGFAVIGLLLSEQVWFRHFNISRALSPLLTLYLLSVAISIRRESKSTSDVPTPLDSERQV